MDVQGFTAPGFQAVAEAFVRNFERYGEAGAAFATPKDPSRRRLRWAAAVVRGQAAQSLLRS